MADNSPSTGGAISGGNWGYSGKSSGFGSVSSNNNSGSKTDYLDLSSYAIESTLGEYEGEEVSAQDVLLLKKGPLDPKKIPTFMKSKIQIEKQKQEKIERMKNAGYNDTDIQRVVSGELTEEELYDEILDEYLAGDDSRMKPLLEASVIGEYFYFQRDEAQEKRGEYQAQLEYLESEEFDAEIARVKADADMYTAIADGCTEARAAGKSEYIYINSEGEEISIPVNQAGYYRKLANQCNKELELLQEMKNSTETYRSEIASLDEKLADPNKEEFTYRSVAEIDNRLTEIDERLKQLRGKSYGYEYSDESFKDPEFIKTYLDEQPTTAWLGVDKEGQNTKGWSIIKIGEDKYVMRNGSSGSSTYIGLDGNPSHDSFTAQELIEAGYVIVPSHGFRVTETSEEDKAEIAELEAEKKKLKGYREEIEGCTDYLLEMGKYFFQRDFEELKEPIEREHLVFTHTPVDTYQEVTNFANAMAMTGGYYYQPIHSNLYMGNAEVLLEDLKEKCGRKGYLAYLLYDEIVAGSSIYSGELNNYYNHSELHVALPFEDYHFYDSFTNHWREYMTQTEKDIFIYLCNKGDYEGAYEFLRKIDDNLEKQYLAKLRADEEAWATENGWNSAWASFRSIFLKPIEGIRALQYSVAYLICGEDVQRSLIYSKADWDRSAIAEEIAKSSSVFSFLYSIGMSMADSGVVIALTAASGGSYGIVYTIAVLGTSVYVTTLNDALDRGFGSTEAMGMALMFAAIEVAMESYSLAHLFNADINYSQFLGRFPRIASKIAKLSTKGQKFVGVLYTILSQSFVEMDEEVWTTILDRGVDYVMGEVSGTGMNMFEYDMFRYRQLHPNCTDEEAYRFAMGQFWNGLKDDALGGLFSGGFFGSFAGAHFASNFDEIVAEYERTHGNNTNTGVGVSGTQLLQMDGYLANGDINALLEMGRQDPNNTVLNETIQSKLNNYIASLGPNLGNYVASLDTKSLTDLILNKNLDPDTYKMLVRAITAEYKDDGSGYKANIHEVLAAVLEQNPEAKRFYESFTENEKKYYKDCKYVDRIETWVLLQVLQAERLANNNDIGTLDLLNEEFAKHGLPTYTNAVDAYFAALNLSHEVQETIKSMNWDGKSKAEKTAYFAQYEWLKDVEIEIAKRNGHTTAGISALSFFQQSGNLEWLRDKGSVGRNDDVSQKNGGTACCNAEEVDAWIYSTLDALLKADPDISAADLEKAFIREYYDYASLQGLEAWEKEFYRAIATNFGDFLGYTYGHCNSAFHLEWCLGGETLGLNEEFMLTHADIPASERAKLGPDTQAKAYIYDDAGNVIGSYDITYCKGLKETLQEMYNSGRITDATQLAQIATWYEKVYGVPIK